MAQRKLEPNMWNLETTFKSIYEIPVYQRPYSWDQEQVEVLFQDILETYKSSEKEDGYYTGNIIVFDKNDKINGIISRYDVIDGQQRLTTFALMLLSVYHLANKCGVPETDITLNTVKGTLWKMINREYKKDYPVVSLNSIEKKCFCDIFEYAFDNAKKLDEFCDKYKSSSQFDDRVLKNTLFLISAIEENVGKECNDILDFAD